MDSILDSALGSKSNLQPRRVSFASNERVIDCFFVGIFELKISASACVEKYKTSDFLVRFKKYEISNQVTMNHFMGLKLVVLVLITSRSCCALNYVMLVGDFCILCSAV